MRKARHFGSLTSLLLVLTAFAACSSDSPAPGDAGADLGTDAGPDLGSDAGPRCLTTGDYRTCQCPAGAGPAFTLACAAYPDDDTCYTYTTTCVDDGFISCETVNFASHALLEARCRAYCATDGGVPVVTPCSGW